MTIDLNEVEYRPGCCADRQHFEKFSTGSKGCTVETCMRLPKGKTCGDCVHASRCKAFGFTPSLTSPTCDFFPRRFLQAKPGPASPST